MKSSVVRLIAGAVLAAGVLTACEDDPILEPTQEKSGGGSYGILTIDSTGAGADVPSSPHGDTQPNPAVF